jgi:AcrR family transcriptional regulator
VTTIDRRVRRSREALMRAAVTVVGARGTSNVAVSEIAEAADVSRQLIYQQFGERDALLLEAALDLFRTELAVADGDLTDRAKVLAMARHFAAHRAFYRAMLTGPCSYALNKALIELISPVNEQIVRQMFGAEVAPEVTLFLTGGAATVVNAWVVEAPGPLDPEEFTDRLMRMPPILRAGRQAEEGAGRRAGRRAGEAS